LIQFLADFWYLFISLRSQYLSMFWDLPGIGFVLEGDALISTCNSDRMAWVPFSDSRTFTCIFTDFFFWGS
jgi:hypothetical protein